MHENQTFSTSEFPLAITLVCLGFCLEGVDKTNPRRCDFVFVHSRELDESIQSYWRRELLVEPQLFFLTSKNLKSRLYDN